MSLCSYSASSISGAISSSSSIGCKISSSNVRITCVFLSYWSSSDSNFDVEPSFAAANKSLISIRKQFS